MRSNVVCLAVIVAMMGQELSVGAPFGTHALRGVLKSLTATTVVVTRGAREAGELTFMLTSRTEREGKLVVGSRVSIRYLKRGRTLIATAIASDP